MMVQRMKGERDWCALKGGVGGTIGVGGERWISLNAYTHMPLALFLYGDAEQKVRR